MNELTWDEVLDEMLYLEDRLDGPTLARWVARCPQFQRELTDFAARWALSDFDLAAQENAPDTLPDAVWTQAQNAALRVVSQSNATLSATSQTPELLNSLLTNCGGTSKTLADALELPLALTLKLQNRLFIYATLPPAFIDRLAQTVKSSRAAVAAYLQMPPQLPAGARYNSKTRPQVPLQESFTDAVRRDNQLTQAQKEQLLSVPTDK